MGRHDHHRSRFNHLSRPYHGHRGPFGAPGLGQGTGPSPGALSALAPATRRRLDHHAHVVCGVGDDRVDGDLLFRHFR